MNKLYIERIEEKVDGRQTKETADATSRLMEITDFNTEFIQPLKQKINEISEAFSEDLKANEIELEVSFGVTGKGNICILSSSSSLGIKVKMKWENSKKQ